MTQKEKTNLIPKERYANIYVETCTDINGVKHEDFKLGDLYKNKEDLPNYYEISCARAIHLGAVKIEIKPLELLLNNPQITIGTKIRSKTNPNVILNIISNDCHGDEFECSNGSVLSLKQIEKYYDII